MSLMTCSHKIWKLKV